MRTSPGEQLEYDALVLALGAEQMPAAPGVLMWDDRSDCELLGGAAPGHRAGLQRAGWHPGQLAPRSPALYWTRMGWEGCAFELGPGFVTDHYDAETRTLRLSQGVGREPEDRAHARP